MPQLCRQKYRLPANKAMETGMIHLTGPAELFTPKFEFGSFLAAGGTSLDCGVRFSLSRFLPFAPGFVLAPLLREHSLRAWKTRTLEARRPGPQFELTHSC